MQKTAIKIKEIAFTGYPTKDIQGARKFYESILNLNPSMVAEDGTWVEYEVNGVALFIGDFEGWNPTVSGPSIAFEVDDINQTIEALRAEKVQIFREVFETPGCWIAIIGDPDGNSIQIHKSKRGCLDS